MNNLGLLYIEDGRFDLALPPLARAVELDGEVAVFRNNLGMALENTGHFRAAEEAYKAAVTIDESYEKAYDNFDRVESVIGDTGLGYEHIYMKSWHPEEKEIIRFLQIVSNPKRTPVLVHCQHGSDRTGTMCAVYRIAVQGWSKEEAIKEMKEGGFGYHGIWKNLVSWIEKLDIEAIKKEFKV